MKVSLIVRVLIPNVAGFNHLCHKEKPAITVYSKCKSRKAEAKFAQFIAVAYIRAVLSPESIDAKT
jgi:hypothetical protein